MTRTAKTDARLEAWLADDYGLTGTISPLGGGGSNGQIATVDGRRFVVKLADDDSPSDVIALEHAAAEAAHADLGRLNVALPRMVRTRGGTIESVREIDGRIARLRVLEWVAGTPWIETRSSDATQRRDLGRALATLDLALARIDVPAARRTHHWDLAQALQHRPLVAQVQDRRALADWAFHVYAACGAPALAALPHSLIHGDANDENVLVDRGRLTGLIDFGDCLWNPTVCELAIAISYAVLDLPDPLAAGAEIVGASHAVRPLSRDELQVLFPLVCGRMAVTVVTAASRRAIDPGHPTWFITEDRAWRLLERLSPIDPAAATATLASETGVETRFDPGAAAPVLLERRRAHVSGALSIAYREPIKMVRGSGQYLYDGVGRPYLDLVNNVCHVGHCHPRVVAAGQQQMARLNTNTRYLYDGLTEYADRLTATLPAPLDTCFFVNSGTEANELALRVAMAHTKRRNLLVVDGAYHGHTSALIAASPYKFMGRGGAGRPEPWVHVVPLPDGYRGAHKGQSRDAGEAYGDEVARVIAQAGAPIAAFMTESFQSCGGQVVPPEGYLERAFRHVRAAGGVCIADEVQTGFGRAGSHFWAFETQNVVPDIVVLGKPIGNGHPMGAVVTSREIAASFANGMEFFSTFGGNPVSCAIGLAVLDVIRDEGLQQRALELGRRFVDGLRALMDRHPIIGDVRGQGLFLGVELVRDRTTLEPAADAATELINRAARRGILLSTDGPLHNVIKIKPPMVLMADDVEMAVRVMDDELGRLGTAQ
ncbi:MAG TPA: aminotransferase class III-fold pyridoxal phosphate-dependent enzyme [Vicinamibacterales bacterium]|nr:aminotransferase class III-fold pyridoxal phosphate-dependent enzyme [Vicinamibacterales bacterium]